MLRLYILAHCILIFGPPSKLLVGVFPLTMSEVSVQHSMLEHANQSIQNAFSANNGQLVGGDGTLNQLELLPFHWPLAKLTLMDWLLAF